MSIRCRHIHEQRIVESFIDKLLRINAFSDLSFDYFFVKFEIVVQEALPVFFGEVCMEWIWLEERELGYLHLLKYSLLR